MGRDARTRLHDDQLDTDPQLVRRSTQQLPHLADRPLRELDTGGTDNAIFRLADDLRPPATAPGAASGLE